jgi:RimJ/RimL family protein N-acetyltransferase
VPDATGPVLPADALRRLEPRPLVGEGVGLRPWAPSDAPLVAAAFADPGIAAWRARQPDEQDDDADAWVRRWAERWAAGTDAAWAVTAPGDDAAQGYVGLRRIQAFDGSAELSYWMLPEARGGGLARRAAATATAWAFAELGLHRVWLVHAVANVRACAVATGAGFRAEGTLRGYLRADAGRADAHLHARLRTD